MTTDADQVSGRAGTASGCAAITIAHGRHRHLIQQLEGIRNTERPPDLHVIVAMNDSKIRDIAAPYGPRNVVLDLTFPQGSELPLGQARNAGAIFAIEHGAQLLVLLDVDCIPGPRLFHYYRDAAADPSHAGAVLCGPVAYLPPDCDLGGAFMSATPHPSRPNPPAGTVLEATDRQLFWSLSFALAVRTWQRIGGFCTDYRGYGGEDTDFAELAHQAGVGMRWVGGATAYHQYHPVSTPPVEHLDAILRNSRLFNERWGWWPMTGWLKQFAELGLVHFTIADGWQLTCGPDR